jgi:hypothetical protein
MDVDTIQPGEDFAKKIEQLLESCDALVALIGDQWVASFDTAGNRRLENSYDFVRTEIASALQRGIPVIPVLVEGVKMPSPSQLPEPLQPLTRLQALEISDDRFDAEAQELITALERHLPRPLRPEDWAGASRRTWILVLAGLGLLAVASPLLLRRKTPQAPPNISGRWRASVTNKTGHVYSVVLDLRSEGDQLLGTVAYPTGVGNIEEGRIEGGRVSFKTRHIPQFENEPATIRLAGEFSADELRLTMQSSGSMDSFVARRTP